MTENEIELKILRVPRQGWPHLSFVRGMYRAERRYQKLIDSGRYLRISLWYGSMEEPLKRWPEEK